MILSHGRRYIFVHIPKTGGTALTLALEDRAMKDDILVGDTPKAVRRRRRLKEAGLTGTLKKHARLAEIEPVLPQTALLDYFIVTLVRNPWDRMVSYYHWLRTQRFAHEAVDLARDLPFPAFVRHPATRQAFGHGHYASYVTDRAGEERCDLFIRLEHLDTDIAPFEAHLGFRLAPLAPANVSDRARDWRTYYDDATAAVVAETCATDIARFGYAFDPG